MTTLKYTPAALADARPSNWQSFAPSRFISGRFIEFKGDSATFLLTTPTAHSQVRLPLESIVSLERKDASQGRSILLSAVLVGGAATLAYLGFEGNENSDPSTDDDLTDQLVPGIRIVIPIGR